MAFAVFVTVFFVVLTIICLFGITSTNAWWGYLFGIPSLFASATVEAIICVYMWEEWV